MKKTLKLLIDIIFNDWLIYKILFIYSVLLKDKVRKARGSVSLDLLKHKGDNCRFDGDVKVYYSDGLILEDHVRIGFGTFIFALGGVKIGKNTQISRNVTIYSANHNTEGSHIPYDDTYIKRSVIIGNSVWIGMNAMILPGVTIGDGAIIGMGAIISKNVKPGEVIVGSQQRVIKKRDMLEFNDKQWEEKYFSKNWPNK